MFLKHILPLYGLFFLNLRMTCLKVTEENKSICVLKKKQRTDEMIILILDKIKIPI